MYSGNLLSGVTGSPVSSSHSSPWAGLCHLVQLESGRQRRLEEGTLTLEAGTVRGERNSLTCHESLLCKSFPLSVRVRVTETLQRAKPLQRGPAACLREVCRKAILGCPVWSAVVRPSLQAGAVLTAGQCSHSQSSALHSHLG